LTYDDYQAGLEADALAGRIFFIMTGSDGSCPAVIYTNELPTTDILDLYDSADRRFLIYCDSGRLKANGVEDFGRASTSTEDEFSLAPGAYSIQFYERVQEKVIARFRAELGDSDWEYYTARADRLPWGCFAAITIVLTAILLFSRFWRAALTVFCLGLVFVVIRRLTQALDRRFKSIEERVDAIFKDLPPYIFVLEAVDNSTDITGGWYDL